MITIKKVGTLSLKKFLPFFNCIPLPLIILLVKWTDLLKLLNWERGGGHLLFFGGGDLFFRSRL